MNATQEKAPETTSVRIEAEITLHRKVKKIQKALGLKHDREFNVQQTYTTILEEGVKKLMVQLNLAA